MVHLATFGRVVGGDFTAALLEDIGNNRTQLLAYGNGKSYGDTCLPMGRGKVLLPQSVGVPEFDEATGLLVASAGMTIAEIILKYGPQNWFVPVTPGTKHVTLGGAIANDVHGKNHHVRGSFGCHVEWLDLVRSDGKTYRCSSTENSNLFAATIGGMGLTGFILRAAIKLMRVSGCNVLEKTIPFQSLERYFEAAEQADYDNEYAVAWVDQLARGSAAGRGLLFVGNHHSGEFAPHKSAKLSVPFVPPISMLNGLSVRAFNMLYRGAKSRKLDLHETHYDPFFYPLDMVQNWNRLYGPRGLHQHQSVIPFDAAKFVIPELLEQSRQAGQVSFLTVIKRFGAAASPALMSFARPGYTLTLDFPHKGVSTLALLETLDRITIECGGAVNPYKDSRMSPATFAASFPNWRALEAMRDDQFMSGFWARTAGRLLAG
jgi:FAD/FMN-containing dehydrogenase